MGELLNSGGEKDLIKLMWQKESLWKHQHPLRPMHHFGCKVGEPEGNIVGGGWSSHSLPHTHEKKEENSIKNKIITLFVFWKHHCRKADARIIIPTENYKTIIFVPPKIIVYPRHIRNQERHGSLSTETYVCEKLFSVEEIKFEMENARLKLKRKHLGFVLPKLIG